MKVSIVLVVVLAATYVAGQASVDITQDTEGNYKYIIDSPQFKKNEERKPDGTVEGQYSFTDADGVVRTYKYTSGPEGFKVIDGPLPVAPVAPVVQLQPVQDTPEVLAARQAHLALLN